MLITGRRRDTLASSLDQLRANGDHADGCAADIATEAGRHATLEAALEKLGGIDILINNAGGVRAGALEDVAEEEIRAMIEVGLVAPVLLTRAALPHLRAGGNGMVVNITSAIALVGLPFYATYAAVKAGLAGSASRCAGN